jgi:hypothetical protein
MGTVYENAVGTAQALAQLKANIDEPFIRFGERMRGAKPADLNVIPKALGKAKDWSPLQYEKGYTVPDKEWGQVTHKPITEAFEKFKTGPSLKDVTGDITKAPQWLAQSVGKLGPQFGAAGAATALTGPFGGILMNAVNNIGERYNTALKEKVNAPASGIFTGLLISAFDTLGPWLQLRGVTKGLLSTAGVGGGTELVQEIMAILHEKFLGIPVKDPFWRLMENFLLGMFIEGGTHAAARPSKAAAQVSTGPTPPPPPGGPPPPPPGAPPAAPTTPAPPSGTPEFTQWAAENGIRTDEKGNFDPSFDPMQARPPAAPAPPSAPAGDFKAVSQTILDMTAKGSNVLDIALAISPQLPGVPFSELRVGIEAVQQTAPAAPREPQVGDPFGDNGEGVITGIRHKVVDADGNTVAEFATDAEAQADAAQRGGLKVRRTITWEETEAGKKQRAEEWAERGRQADAQREAEHQARMDRLAGRQTAPVAQPGVDIQPPQPAAPVAVEAPVVEQAEPIPDVNQPDVWVKDENGIPQRAHSEDVLVDRTLQAAGIEEPKPAVSAERLAQLDADAKVAEEQLRKLGLAGRIKGSPLLPYKFEDIPNPILGGRYRFFTGPGQTGLLYANFDGMMVLESASGNRNLAGLSLSSSEINDAISKIDAELNQAALWPEALSALKQLRDQLNNYRQQAGPKASLNVVMAERGVTTDIKGTAYEELLHGTQRQAPLPRETVEALMAAPVFAKARGSLTASYGDLSTNDAFDEVTAKVLAGNDVGLSTAEQVDVARAYRQALIEAHGEGVLVLFKYVKPGVVKEAFRGRETRQEGGGRPIGVEPGGGGQFQPGATGGGAGASQGGRSGSGVRTGAAPGMGPAGRASLLDPAVIRIRARMIAGDVARDIITAGNAVEKIVAKWGEQYRPVAPQIFQQAQEFVRPSAPGMPSAAPQTAPGASAAPPASVTATQPAGSPQGQPAPVSGQPPVPPEPPLGAMPDATDPEQPPASAFSTAVKTFGRYNRRMLQLRQAAWRHPNFAPLQAMVQAMDRMNKAIFQWKDRGGDVSAAWRALGPARAQVLNDFSLAATQWSDKLGRKLTPEERGRLGAHHGVDGDILEVYDQQQQYFQDSWDAMRQAYIAELQAEITNPETLAAATAEINAQFDEKMRHNYFPLQRFGRWMVTGWEIGPDGKEFVGQHEHYTSERAAKIAKREMERRYREAGTRISRVTHTENNPETRDLGGLPPGMADRIAKDLNLDEKQRKELDRAIDNVKAASVTQRSALRHLLRRKGTKGFSRDAQRAFEAYVTWAANHIGKTQERANLKQAVRDAEKARNNVGAYSGQAVNPMPLTRLHALMKDSLDNMLNPRVQNNSFMGSAASWFLGFGPIQIAQNFIQSGNTPFVLAKEMGADGNPIGLPEAIKQWAKAMKDVSQVYSKRWYDKKTNPTPGNQYDYRGPISDEEWALMEEGRKEGLTGDTNANQASGNAKQSTFEYLFTWPFGHDPFNQESKGKDMGRKGRAWDDWIHGFGRFSLKGHQWSEEWTRRVGLLAAARAFKNRGNAAPYQAARDVVLKVQGSHEPSNRSWLQQKAPAALVFKSFLLNNIWLTHQTKAGRMLWLAQLVLGGARGMLGASHIFLLLSLLGSVFNRKFFGMKDPYVDIEHTIREMITERMGPRAARVALHGVSGGIAGAPDLSNSFNFGEPIPGLNPTMRWLGGRDDTKTWFWNMGQAAGGAVGGTAMNLSKALVEEGPESENFLRLAMPRWLGNILKAQQAWREERYATTKGTGLAKIDRNNPIHMLELAGYAAGMTPERLAEVREAMNSTQEMERYYTKLMDDARQEYYEAQRSKDQDTIRNASDYVQFVKSILPEGMSNKLNRMQQGFGQAERRREQRDRGIPNDRSLRRAREDWLTPYQLEPR